MDCGEEKSQNVASGGKFTRRRNYSPGVARERGAGVAACERVDETECVEGIEAAHVGVIHAEWVLLFRRIF